MKFQSFRVEDFNGRVKRTVNRKFQISRLLSEHIHLGLNGGNHLQKFQFQDSGIPLTSTPNLFSRCPNIIAVIFTMKLYTFKQSTHC